jgi:hypothetical protein
MPQVKFIPTAEQRNFVMLMAVARLTHEQVASVIINRQTGKPISKRTLQSAFKAELATAATKMKSVVMSKFYQALLRGDQWAISFGLRHFVGIRDNDLTFSFSGDYMSAEDTGIELHFVKPDRVRRLAEEQDHKAKVTKVIEGFPVADLKPL